MPTQATYDDANLILRLYEIRREEKLRSAREWFMANYRGATLEEINQIAPQGTKENSYIRMVLSYWDMAASFVTSGVLNQELFFQSNGELLVTWERFRDVLPGLREMFKNPVMFENLETVGKAYIKYLDSRGPEIYPAFSQMVRTPPPTK